MKVRPENINSTHSSPSSPSLSSPDPSSLSSPHPTNVTNQQREIRYLKPDDSSFSQLVYGFVYPQIIIITFITNLLICIVLLRKNMRNPTNTLLVAMAISDMLTGLTALPVYIRFYSSGLNEYVPYDWCWIYLYLSNYIPTIFHTASIWLTVALAIHRYISVCHSQTAKRLCSKRNTAYVVVIIYVAAAFSQMSRFFECTYLPYPIQFPPQLPTQPSNSSTQPPIGHPTSYFHSIPNNVTTNNNIFESNSSIILGCIEVPNDFIAAYDHLYFVSYYVARLVLIHFIPCGLLIVLNAVLVQTMTKAKRRRSQLLKQNRKTECRRLTESNLTTMMLVAVVGLFLLVEVPMAVMFIVMMVDNTFSLGLLNDHLHYAVPQWINFFILVSYPFNFFIYCAMSHQFRNTFKELFCCCCCPNRERMEEPMTVGGATKNHRVRGGASKKL